MKSVGKWTTVGLVASLVVVLDQITKLAIWHWLRPLGQVKVVPGLFDLSFVFNPGVAFGFMAGSNSSWRVTLLLAAAVLALAALMFLVRSARPGEGMFIWGLALVSGGALGNAVDRVRLGAVIDFLDFYIGPRHWPVFNVADIGISMGCGLILIHFWIHRHDTVVD